ncbi:MAG TPA: HAD family hydrolase [Candidatus Paceibacterota bacterium]|nr:HAD family hydrolase [Candidatus Paceibacterota bacterium]
MAQDRESSKTPSGTPSLIIFDCDGVLVDSEVISIAIDEIVLADLGWQIGKDEIIARFVGRSHDHFLKVVEEHIGYKLPNDWEDSYQHLYREAMLRDLRPVAGIIDALDSITVPSCVASNGSHEKMQFTLGLTGLLTRFEGRIFSASEVSFGKPAPDLFLHASSILGYGPSDCVVVEDSVAGVQAALAADMNVIAYAGGVTPREQLELFGVSVIDHMSELPQSLEKFAT